MRVTSDESEQAHFTLKRRPLAKVFDEIASHTGRAGDASEMCVHPLFKQPSWLRENAHRICPGRWL